MKGKRNILYEKRYKRRMTQQALGDAVGVCAVTVAAWEKSLSRLPEAQAERCARVLGCRVEELLPLCDKESLCLTHEDKMKEYARYRRRYDRLKQSGACVDCGEVDGRTRKGRTRCKKCYDLQKKSVRRLQDERVAEHRCILCGEELPEGCTRKKCKMCARRHKTIKNRQ